MSSVQTTLPARFYYHYSPIGVLIFTVITMPLIASQLLNPSLKQVFTIEGLMAFLFIVMLTGQISATFFKQSYIELTDTNIIDRDLFNTRLIPISEIKECRIYHVHHSGRRLGFVAADYDPSKVSFWQFLTKSGVSQGYKYSISLDGLKDDEVNLIALINTLINRS